MRVAELIRVELERAREIVPGPWMVVTAVEVHQALADELEVPYLDSIHGEHLHIVRIDKPDLVVLMPAIKVHVFSGEEAVAAAGFNSNGRVRQLFIPSARLTAPAAVEAYQALRRDGVSPDRAEEVAAIL